MALMHPDEMALGENIDPRLARLLAEIGPRLRAPKEELVSEIEAHLTDLLGIDLDEALRAIARGQNINRFDGARLERAHKAVITLLAHVLYQARVKNGGAGER